MIKAIRARMGKNEDDGFTLIELLVVVLILGILMAIAIPTYLSLTNGAKTNAAEADLTNAGQDEAAYITQYGSYGSTTTTPTIGSIDAGINWQAGTGTVSPAQKDVAVTTGGTTADPTAALITQGADQKWYFLDLNDGVQTYGIDATADTAPGTFYSSWTCANNPSATGCTTGSTTTS